MHYYRLLYDLTQEKRPRHLNESIITTDGLMSFITTDFCMTAAFHDSKHVYEFDYYRPRHLKESRITTDTLMPVNFITTDFRMIVAVGTDKSNDFDHFAK